MYLTNLTHRKELFELTTRWFSDSPRPSDGRFLTQLAVYANLVCAPAIQQILNTVIPTVYAGAVTQRRVRSKDELRSAIVDACKDPSYRETELFSYYEAHPEEFFPGTPTDVVLRLREDGSILGMTRIKRLRRIAEKCSRRLSNHLAETIADKARQITLQRAVVSDIYPVDIRGSEEERVWSFIEAEKEVAQSFREHKLIFRPSDLQIDDGIGLKFVGTPEELESIQQSIANHPAVVGIEREEHHGNYNDINLLVDIRLPPPESILRGVREEYWENHSHQGLAVEDLATGFPAFLHSGESTIRAEIILTTHENLVESEFGRSIHEVRIIQQRSRMHYDGRIAANASFLIEYMLMLAISPKVEVNELPVKMWGRYLPDAFASAVWQLFGISMNRSRIDQIAFV